jgi:hypothetical protein
MMDAHAGRLGRRRVWDSTEEQKTEGAPENECVAVADTGHGVASTEGGQTLGRRGLRPQMGRGDLNVEVRDAAV